MPVAGTQSKWSFGDQDKELGDYAWFVLNAESRTHPVGQKKPNAWGLYDMHGNVSEWSADRYLTGYYAESPGDDPQGPASGSNRVVCGGSWRSGGARTRSATSSQSVPVGRLSDRGFRVAQTP